MYCPGTYFLNREKCESVGGYVTTPRSIYGCGKCGARLFVHKVPFTLQEHVKTTKTDKTRFFFAEKRFYTTNNCSTRQKMELGERRSRESPCFLMVIRWTKTRSKCLAKLSREQEGEILNTTNISVATVLYSQLFYADISSSYLQHENSWHVKISNQDVRMFCDVRKIYAWAIKQLSQHF